MPNFLVVVSDNRHSNYEIEREILKQVDAELRICNCVTEEDMLRDCINADGILLDMAPMTAPVVKALRRCKIVNRYGVGYDNVDVNACTENGIWVSNVPDYCAQDVSDHALALLFSCLRQVPLRDKLVRQGEWNINTGKSFRLAEKTLGVLGFGRIAKALIHKVSGFGFKQILVYDPYVQEKVISKLGAKKVELETVLADADFISLHMPVTSETRGIINRETIGLMKSTAILINTGRGPLIDDAALLEALKQSKIGFAGLDTHNTEPLPADSAYMKLDNVVLTDHTAYNTEEALIELKTKAAKNIVAVLEGKTPKYPVNRISNI